MGERDRVLTVVDQIHARDEVRRRIVDAASSLYARKGFHATSMEEIAEAARVALPVVHGYVKSKSGIMSLIMEDLLQAFQEALTAETEGVTEPAEELATALGLFCRLVDQEREKVLLLYWKSNSLDREARGRVMELEVSVSRIFGRIIEDGVAAGVFSETDPDLAAYNLVMIAYMWALKGWHLRRRLGLDEFIERELGFALKALGV